MYFNNDIKINKFINRSDFNTYLNCMFRTNSSQNLTNELTPENKCYTMDNPEDIGVFQFDLKARKAIKNRFFDQWNNDVDHLFFLLELNALEMIFLNGMNICIRKCSQSCMI